MKLKKIFLIGGKFISSLGTKIKNSFLELVSRGFWWRVGREVSGFFNKFSQTIKVLRPNERRVITILSIIVIICAVILFRNYYLAHTTLNPQKGGVYTEGIIGSPKYLNPLFARSEVDRDISRILFLSLINGNSKGEFEPALAREFKVLDEGKRYDFVLDERISWQDKEKITADDISFTLSILQSEGYTGPYNSSFDGIVFEKKSDQEFSLILPESNSTFVSSLSEVGILPRHKLESVKPELLDKNDFNLNPVGSGQFGLEAEAGNKNGQEELTLKKEKTYVKDDQAYLDKIIFRFYDSFDQIIEAYHKGEINGFGGFTPDDIKMIDRNSFRYYRLEMPRFSAVFLNLGKEPMADLKMRQALALAIDKKRIVDEVYGGDAEILKTPFSFYFLSSSTEATDYPLNLAMSEENLAALKYVDSDQDGVKEKDGKKLELFVYVTDDPALRKTAELVKEDWQKIGVKAKVVVIDLLTLEKSIIPAHQYDAIILGENLGYPPDPYPYFHSSQIKSGLNISQYKNLAVDSLLEETRMANDPSTRAEKLAGFAKFFSQDLPAIPLASAPYLYGANIALKGIPKVMIGGSSSDRFLEIGSWYIKTQRKSK